VGTIPTPPPGAGDSHVSQSGPGDQIDGGPVTVSPPALLQIREVSKSYGGHTALAGIDLDAAAGQVHGLLGPNGAGKTTLLSLVLGLANADGGSVTVSGAPVGTPQAAAVTAGLVEPAFWPYLSGRANLAALARLDGGAARVRVDAELARVGLVERADTRVGGWSLGMRQRLGIAAALLRRPRLLVLDEPTNGLDPESLLMFRALVRQLAADGVAVLLSSHAIGEVAGLADRVTILAAGRVAFTGATAELAARAADPEHRMLTSDDTRAAQLATDRPGLRMHRASDGGLLVIASQSRLDDYVLQLAAAGIAVRRLTLATDPLEALFFHLTDAGAA